MKILFYGRLGEALGREVDVDLPGGTDTVAQLRAVLSDRLPDTSGELLQRARACVGDEIVGESYRIGDAREVEFLPPLSGG